MELLATVDWLVSEDGIEPKVTAIKEALTHWPGGDQSAARKSRLFDDRIVGIALDSLKQSELLVR